VSLQNSEIINGDFKIIVKKEYDKVSLYFNAPKIDVSGNFTFNESSSEG